jgi:outer membrane biosynthesis protein TonB
MADEPETKTVGEVRVLIDSANPTSDSSPPSSDLMLLTLGQIQSTIEAIATDQTELRKEIEAMQTELEKPEPQPEPEPAPVIVATAPEPEPTIEEVKPEPEPEPEPLTDPEPEPEPVRKARWL